MNRQMPPAERMKCMEVWGGKRHAEKHFEMPGLDVWIWSRSLSEASAGGGDLHYLSSCASGRITRVVLADVCANGSMFEKLALNFRDLMIRNVNLINQTHFVRSLNKSLTESVEFGGLATALVSTYFAPNRSYTFCNAGHPPPILYQARSRRWSEMKGAAGSSTANTPLGVMAESEYQQLMVELEPGDMVLSYGNHVTELSDSRGRILGVDGLLQMLRDVDTEQPSDIVPRLFRQLRDASGSLGEDVTICLCRVTDRAVRWRDNLAAPLRLLGSVSDQTLLS